MGTGLHHFGRFGAIFELSWHGTIITVMWIAIAVGGIVVTTAMAGWVRTRRRRRPESVGRSREALLNSDAALFHLMRTPLTSLLGHLEQTLSAPLTSEVRESLEVARRQALQLAELVQHSQSRHGTPEHRTPEPTPACRRLPTDLNAVVRDCAQSHRPLAARRRISVSLELPDEPLVITCFPRQVQGVIDILLTNAVNYNRDNGWIDVSLSGTADEATLVVTNVGLALKAKEMRHVFDVGFRGRAALKSGVAGSGLGLHLARTLVEQHHGTLAISRGPDEGVTIASVTLLSDEPSTTEVSRRDQNAPTTADDVDISPEPATEDASSTSA